MNQPSPGIKISFSSSERMKTILAKYQRQEQVETSPFPRIELFAPEHAKELAKSETIEIYDKYGSLITLNQKQSSFTSLASSGLSCVLIGAAGTGKTTCQQAVVKILIQSGRAGILTSDGHKYLNSGSPGIIICAFTRRAVNNIRRSMPFDLQSNCISIHKLLEYQPTYYQVIDPINGEEKTKMVFEATRHAGNPLPESIHTIIFEETSMLSVDLHKQVLEACPHKPQIIYLGDIQQLPPVFGPAILGFKLLELPTEELTEVYRQALESPIIALAHRVLSGKGLEAKEFSEWKKPGQLTIHPWKKRISAEDALNTASHFFTAAYDSKAYDPEEDIILIPFNKSFGTDELNKKIANHLARKRSAETFEIIAGFNKLYLSPGDKVIYDKEDAIVSRIVKNEAYSGAIFLPSSSTLDYWGFDPTYHSVSSEQKMSEDAIDFLLSQTVALSGEDRVRQASHLIYLQMQDSEIEIKLDKAAELNNLSLGYCLTVHKAQGSEWRKVFLVLHQSHATMIQRELLYTAITRAKEELYIICEPDSFVKGIQSQKVKGNTLAEKAEYFKGKIENGGYSKERIGE